MKHFWTYAGESGTTLKQINEQNRTEGLFENSNRQYSANYVNCRRPGPGHLLNLRYREPTHDSKQQTDYNAHDYT